MSFLNDKRTADKQDRKSFDNRALNIGDGGFENPFPSEHMEKPICMLICTFARLINTCLVVGNRNQQKGIYSCFF